MIRIKTLATALVLSAAPASGFAFQTTAPSPARNPQVAPGTAVQQQPRQVQTRPAQVQTRPAQVRPGQAQPAPRFNDRLFTMVAADSGMAEVAAARMAAERSENDEIKKFAQQLIKDHEKANQQLMALAQTIQAPISRRLSPAKQAELAILSSKTGAEFDQAFVDQQLATHLCAVALFQAEAQQGQNPDLKQFASDTLPKLRQHLQMVRSLPGTGSEK